MTSSPFDYRFAVEEDILRFGKLLEGTRLGQIEGALLGAGSVRGKGEAGLAIERYFGIPPNGISDADFPAAGLELKVVPLIRSGASVRVKERTVIGMINYTKIIEETWSSAHVRKKLSILLVFVEHIPKAPKTDFPIRKLLIWRPDDRQQMILKKDWETVKKKVADGLAHELSESDGRLMGPCTKAANSSSRVRQPVTRFASVAKPRAFALKPSFTRSLYEASVGGAPEESLSENLAISDIERLEAAVIERFTTYLGKTLEALADELGVPRSSGKGYAGAVTRRLVGARDFQSRITEFEEMGVKTKTARIDPHFFPYESMSFPHFKYGELIAEEWEESTFLTQMHPLLVVPFVGTVKSVPAGKCTLARPVLWRPSPRELEVAEREWTMFRDLICKGKAKDLPGERSTQMLHVRPHARDARDTDEAPTVGPVVKKSFWLNRRFVQSILTASEA